MLVRNAGQTAAADQFLRSITSVQGEIQNADSALNSVVTTLQRADEPGCRGRERNTQQLRSRFTSRLRCRAFSSNW